MIKRGRLGWRGELSGVDENRRAVDTHAIVDSEPWKARRWMEADWAVDVIEDAAVRDVGDKEASNLWRRSDGKGQRRCGKPVHDVIWIVAKVVQSLFLAASLTLRE